MGVGDGRSRRRSRARRAGRGRRARASRSLAPPRIARSPLACSRREREPVRLEAEEPLAVGVGAVQVHRSRPHRASASGSGSVELHRRDEVLEPLVDAVDRERGVDRLLPAGRALARPSGGSWSRAPSAATRTARAGPRPSSTSARRDRTRRASADERRRARLDPVGVVGAASRAARGRAHPGSRTRRARPRACPRVRRAACASPAWPSSTPAWPAPSRPGRRHAPRPRARSLCAMTTSRNAT